MKTSQIIVAKNEADEPKQDETSKVATAYLHERNQLEYTEVELSRAKVIVLDEEGNVSRLPIFLDH
ncbi:hypothetical protein M9194_00285 [Vibrio sp. S4M6]|uniref:hypothetical protein n=1 Tax=Vibrio sinus TaxID=2946865 RepID=UPI00202A08EE|nr:hypothetical protein [Vibrio sinus]MCL9779869.1 hypothetical protein [Vibrio sinus]